MDIVSDSPDQATADHLCPKRRGGQNAWHNVVAACAACNAFRGSDFTELQFYRLRKKLLKSGDWPPCTRPPKRIRKFLTEERITQKLRRDERQVLKRLGLRLVGTRIEAITELHASNV